MQDLVLIFIYSYQDAITNIHLNSIKLNNPNIPIYTVNKNDFVNKHYKFLGHSPITEWSIWDLWYKCDNLFLYWYLSNTIKAKNYLLVEWDTHCLNTSFMDFFGDQLVNNQGISSCLISLPSDQPNDHWFNGDNLNLITKFFQINEIKKLTPMSCTVISHDCLCSIIDYIKQYPEINNIYVETKFPTIAEHLKFPVKQYKQNQSIPYFQYVSYHENICERTLNHVKHSDKFMGIFHPIKKYDIYAKYINNSNIEKISKNANIHKIIYGSNIDITELGKKILSNNEILTANNSLAGDPAPFASKEMTIIYEESGKIFTKSISEHQKIQIV